MTNFFSTIVLGIEVLFGLGTFLSAGLRPHRFASRLGLTIANAGGVNEVRAQYAAFFLAIAIVCAAAIIGIVQRSSALIVVIVTFGGLFAGRIVSLALNRGVAGFSKTIVILHFTDFAGTVLAIAALALQPPG